MEKQFVPYDLSVRLKKLGFDEPCLLYFNKQENYLLWQDLDSGYYKNSTVNIGELLWGGTYDNGNVSAPIYQQAFDWCLDKLNQSHSFYVCFGGSNKCSIIQNYFTNIPVTLLNGTKEKCLEKLIEMIEQQ